mgnify:CR=1 FL=1
MIERVLVIVPTYNEATNLPRSSRPFCGRTRASKYWSSTTIRRMVPGTWPTG